MALFPAWPAVALAMLAGNLVMHAWPRLPPMWLPAALASVAVLGLAWQRRMRPSRRAWFVALACVAMTGYAVAAVRGNQAMDARLPVALEGTDFLVEGTMASLPMRNHDSIGFLFDIERNLDSNTFTGRVRVAWYGKIDTPPACSRWQLLLRLKRPRGLSNPGGTDAERAAVVRGIAATGYVRDGPLNRPRASAWCIDRAREAISMTVADRLGGARAARLLLALAIGDTRGMTDDDWQVARATGTAHLVAISGLHTGMAALAGAWMLGLAWRAWPRLGLYVPRRTGQALAAGLVVVPYVMLAGAGLPAVRSMLMVCIVAFAHLRRRRVAPGDALSMAAVAVLLLDPMAPLAAGSWLSFAGVAFLAGMLEPGQRGVRGWCLQLLRMQVLMTLALMPLTVAFFGQWSWIGMLVNLLVAPFVSVVVVPLALAGALLLHGVEPLAVPVLRLATLGMDGAWWLVQWFAGIPHGQWLLPVAAPLPVALGVLGALWCCAPRGWPRRWLGALPMLALAWPVDDRPRPGQAHAWVWDVGQGLSVLVRTQGHAVLVDAGPRARSGFDLGAAVVVPALRQVGVAGLDQLIISHGDVDHAGGAAAVALAHPQARRVSGEPGRVRPRAGACVDRSWTWDGVRFHAWPASTVGPSNDRSCVLLVTTAAGRLFLPGDGGKAVEPDLARTIGVGSPLALVVAHHGSAGASSQAFLDAVQPTHAVFSAGWRNRFGHPHPKVVARLDGIGAIQANTATDGAIRIELGARAPAITWRWRRDQPRWWRE